MIDGPPLRHIWKRPLAAPGPVIYAVTFVEVDISGARRVNAPDSAEVPVSECLESSLDCPAPAQVNIFRLCPPR